MKLPDDKIPGRALILDGDLVRRIYDERAAPGRWPRDEVWDGLLVLLPLLDNEHQRIVFALATALHEIHGHRVYPGVNLSDRAGEWMSNFRCPDICVYAEGNCARDHGTHFEGGPDFLVEIATPNEDPRLKNDFYAAVGSREVLIVGRKPWVLGLYQLQADKYVLAGRSEGATPATFTSSVLPLTFRLRPAAPRPVIEMTHTGTGQVWTA